MQYFGNSCCYHLLRQPRKRDKKVRYLIFGLNAHLFAAPHSPKKRGPLLNLRMKSVSLDSPECGFDQNKGCGSVAGSCGGLCRRNMSVPKVVETAYSSSPPPGGENNNFSHMGGSSRRYGTWVHIVKSRMAAQMAANNQHYNNVSPSKRRMIPPSSMEFGTATSAPASSYHCKFCCS